MTAGSSARGPRGVHCVADAYRGSSGSRGAAVVAVMISLNFNFLNWME